MLKQYFEKFEILIGTLVSNLKCFIKLNYLTKIVHEKIVDYQ